MDVYFIMLGASILGAFLFSKSEDLKRSSYINDTSPMVVPMKAVFGVIMFLPLFLVSALRYSVGVDYNSYAGIFNSVVANGTSYVETGYVLLNQLVARITTNSDWIFILTSFIITGLCLLTIAKWSDCAAWSVFVFVCMGYYFSSLNVIRQYIAVSIVFWGIGFLIKGKQMKYLLTILSAAFFHKTAVFMLPFAFLIRLKLKASYYLAITIFSFLISLGQEYIMKIAYVFFPIYEGSSVIVHETFSIKETIYYIGLFSFFFFLGLKFYRKIIQTPKGVILFNSVFYCFIIYCFFSFVPIINRICLYLEINIILFLPHVLSVIEDKRSRWLIGFIIGLGLMFIFIYSIGRLNRFGVLPYRTILSK